MFAGVTPSRRSAFTFLPRTVRRVTRSCVFAIFCRFAFVRFEINVTVRARDEGNKACSKASNELYIMGRLGAESVGLRRAARSYASRNDLREHRERTRWWLHRGDGRRRDLCLTQTRDRDIDGPSRTHLRHERGGESLIQYAKAGGPLPLLGFEA